MISVLLAKKIAELFVYLFLGVLLVKTRVMKVSDAKVLSTLTLYLIMPCVILRSFQVDMTSEVLSGLAIACAAAVLIHILYFTVGWAFGRFSGATDIEKGSVIYTNCGNLVLPIIISVIGAEWVIYQSAYAAVFNIMIWTHGRMIIAGREAVQLKKIILNVNIIAILCGILLLVTGTRFSGMPLTIMNSLADMIGPLSMVVTGFILAGMDLTKMKTMKRLPLVVLVRMIVCPLLVLLLFKVTNLAGCAEGGKAVLLISFLSAIAPSSATINQFAIIFDRDAEYSAAINVVTTLSCIVTMPLMVMLYEHLL